MVTAVETRERPILFSGPMVRAILTDKKTQTRRVVKPQLTPGADGIYDYVVNGHWRGAINPRTGDWNFADKCPYGVAGSRLWARETWFKNAAGEILYRADYGPESYEGGAKGWKPSIHMPRALSRISLAVEAVRIERVQTISEADAIAEGIKVATGTLYRPLGSKEPMRPYTHRQAFSAIWDSINEARGYSWENNPWVWVITFRRIR